MEGQDSCARQAEVEVKVDRRPDFFTTVTSQLTLADFLHPASELVGDPVRTPVRDECLGRFSAVAQEHNDGMRCRAVFNGKVVCPRWSYAPGTEEGMEPDDLLCSRNARPRKALVGRAQ